MDSMDMSAAFQQLPYFRMILPRSGLHFFTETREKEVLVNQV